MSYTNRKVSLHFPSFIQFFLTVVLSASAFPAISAEKPYCRWGDCEDGLGEKIYPSSSGGKPWSYIANFRDGKRYKYAIRMREGSNWICEVPYTTRGNRSGLQFCATEGGSIEFAYVDPKGKVKGSPYLRLFKGKITEVGKWFATDNVWSVPINLDDLYRDQKALRKTGSRLDEFLPRWFPEYKTRRTFVTEKEMLAAIEASNRKASDSKSTPLSRKNTSISTNNKLNGSAKPGCQFGDCINGFGGYLYASGSQYIGGWKESYRDGYGIDIDRTGKQTCESFRKNKKTEGLQVCLTTGLVATARFYLDGKKSGDSIAWDARSGNITSISIWSNGKYSGQARIDMRGMEAAWTKLKTSNYGAMRSSFLEDEFVSLTLPEDTQSQWLRDRELARASKTQQIPAEAPMKLGCISGNCEDGFGEFATPDMTIAGIFKNRRVSGYTLITSSEQQCESRMAGGFHAGMEHCVDIQSGNHSFAYRYKAGLKSAKLTISPDGDLVSYRVYEDDEEISIAFSSEAEKREVASIEFAEFYWVLSKFKRKAPREARVLRVASLEKIPPITFGSDVDDAYEEPIEKPKTVSKPQRSTKTKSPENTKPKAKIVAKSSSVAPANPPRAVSKSERDKPKSNLQRLAYIVAELNAGSRQINFNYRLDKVRIDPNKFELVYEFTAMVPIRELDTSVLSVANQTAYCSSSKLRPFRDENMPARWAYIDDEDQTFEVITGVSDCS